MERKRVATRDRKRRASAAKLLKKPLVATAVRKAVLKRSGALKEKVECLQTQGGYLQERGDRLLREHKQRVRENHKLASELAAVQKDLAREKKRTDALKAELSSTKTELGEHKTKKARFERYGNQRDKARWAWLTSSPADWQGAGRGKALRHCCMGSQ